ncbi:hypothetical protein [Desulfogranum japonicum]|uniref:hypothetical protein n=1 Tax=Desulfogranum japonicum TaxID=231447 RepID=UPI000405C5FB|nr:hypothetical protein [Desulfogranum japonicum]
MIVGELIFHGTRSIDVGKEKYAVGGTLDIDGSAAKRRIMIFHRQSGALLCTSMSQEDGTWRSPCFPKVSDRKLLVVAVDDTGEFNAVPFDHVTMEQLTMEDF